MTVDTHKKHVLKDVHNSNSEDDVEVERFTL